MNVAQGKAAELPRASARGELFLNILPERAEHATRSRRQAASGIGGYAYRSGEPDRTAMRQAASKRTENGELRMENVV